MLVDLFLLRMIRSVDLCLSQFPSMGLPSQVSIRDYRPHLYSSFGIILLPKTVLFSFNWVEYFLRKSYGLYLMSFNTAPLSSGGARSTDSAAPRRSKRPKSDCIPASSRSVKVIYIQTSGNKTCNRTLMESMVNIDLPMT